MSLYMAEEICRDCRHAVWHDCCNKMCYCLNHNEEDRDHIRGKCEHKELETDNPKTGG